MSSNDVTKSHNEVIAYINIDDVDSSPESSIPLRKRKASPSKHKKTKKTKQSIDESSNSSLSHTDASKCCWLCHSSDGRVRCYFCVRYYHRHCLDSFYDESQFQKDYFVCPECVLTMLVDCKNYSEKSSKSKTKPKQQQIKYVAKSQLKECLLYIVLRLFHYNGEDVVISRKHHYKASHFQEAVDEKYCKDYYKVIKHPMYLSLLKQRIEDDYYNSVQQFYSDFKWIYHNCIIYNGDNSMTSCARNIDHLCIKEISLLESCPKCFLIRLPYMVKFLKNQDPSKIKNKWRFSFDSYPVNDYWMAEMCDNLHPLVWVRLQGYPTWPGKLVKTDAESALVLFFGDYDLNLVPIGSMFMHITKTSGTSKSLGTSIDSPGVDLASGGLMYDIQKEYQLAKEQLQLYLDKIRLRYVNFTEPPKRHEHNIQKGIDHYRRIQNGTGGTIGSSQHNDSSSLADNSDSGANQNPPNQSIVFNRSLSCNVSSSSNINNNIPNYKLNRSEKQDILHEIERNFNTTKSLTQSRYNFIDKFKNNILEMITEFESSYWDSFADHSSRKVVPQDQTPTPEQSTTVIAEHSVIDKVDGITQTDSSFNICAADVIDEVIANKMEIIDKSQNNNSALTPHTANRSQEEYINYLEHKLSLFDEEMRRHDLKSIVRHEELALESYRQQRELRRLYEADLHQIIDICVKKFKFNEWCAYCGKAALFYCCWNTCYCNNDCQARHWSVHRTSCVQLAKQQQHQQQQQHSSGMHLTTGNPHQLVTNKSSRSINTVNTSPAGLHPHQIMTGFQQQQQRQQHQQPFCNGNNIGSGGGVTANNIAALPTANTSSTSIIINNGISVPVDLVNNPINYLNPLTR